MRRRLAQNTLLLSVSQVTARGIGFVYTIFLARALGVYDFGLYSFTMAFVYNFIQVADFGLERLVIRDLARRPQEAAGYLARLVPLRLVLALAALALVGTLGLLTGRSDIKLVYLLAFGLLLIPTNLVALMTAYLNSQERVKYMAGANLAQIILTFSFGALFVYLKLGLVVILLAYPLATFLILFFFLLRAVRWGIPLGWRIDPDFWKKKLGESWIFAALLILAVFYLRLSTVMVGLLLDPEATGLYSSASRFVEAMILIPQSLALALFPLSSKLIQADKAKLKEVYRKGLVVLLLASLPFALALILGAGLLTGLAYGREYLPAVPVFRILGVAVILFFVNSLAGNIIHNSRQIRRFLPAAAANFGFLLILCLILVPRYSITGAAWAVVGGEVFGLVINNVYVWRILKESKTPHFAKATRGRQELETSKKQVSRITG